VRALALLLCLVVVGGCAAPVTDRGMVEIVQAHAITHPATVYERIHAATFQLSIGHYGCSGTAVGPHSLLSAGHCFDGTPSRILINGGYCDISNLQLDGHDHAILTTAAPCRFSHWVAIGAAPKQGDQVFLYGNPLDFSDQLRFGRMSGWGYVPDEYKNEEPGFDGQFELFDVDSAPGDSGSGIFNDKGELVAVLSIGTIVFSYPLQLVGALPLSFTKAQLHAAGL
jgi:hypothetical protein